MATRGEEKPSGPARARARRDAAARRCTPRPTRSRCKRFAMFIEDGEIKAWKVSEGPDDPAGDEDPSATTVDAMIAAVDEIYPYAATEL